jgi:glycosyltransferase involved in cell wall biosynthesis
VPLACHLVTSTNDVALGGLPETVDRVATHLAVESQARVVLYTLGRASPSLNGHPYRVEDLSEARAWLAAPLSAAPGAAPPLRPRRPSPEEFQINRLLLLARLQAAIEEHADARHVLVSFFLTTVGFTAQLVAQELGLPHVAFISGSDLNRDAASPAGRTAAAFVVEHAAWIVASSREQVVRLDRLFRRHERVSVSPGALPTGFPSAYWKPHRREHVALVADCGYSFKKATHSLVEAFARLRGDGHPAKLTIVGRTDPEQVEYWRDSRRAWEGRFGPAATFRDHVTKAEVERLLLDGDVYCSASLGEGSPQGALFAMALGMPVVAPAASSIADLMDPDGDRLALFQPGDRQALDRCLAKVVRRVREDPRAPDCDRIDALRQQLRHAEAQAWTEAIATVARAS